MSERSENGYEVLVDDFFKFDIPVECPTCSKKAVVRKRVDSSDDAEGVIVLVVCPNCGYNKRLSEKPVAILTTSNPKGIKGSFLTIGAKVDPYFNLPLWLVTDFEGHTLWAYNVEHLNFLRNHVEAKLRERKGKEYLNRSLGSRLPKWMTSAKNRQKVLKKIDFLQNKASET